MPPPPKEGAAKADAKAEDKTDAKPETVAKVEVAPVLTVEDGAWTSVSPADK